VQHQRSNHKNKKLSKEKLRLLDEIGFIWDPLEGVWNDRFDELVAFRDRFGHCNVAGTWKENPQLAKWVQHQRTRRRDKNLSADRTRRLDGLGFDWGVLETAWNDLFNELTAYKNRFGDCIVPMRWKENPKLGSWVSNQRTNYRTGKLSSDRIRRLDELGFVWKREKGHPVAADS